jgi:hypothetical protein
MSKHLRLRRNSRRARPLSGGSVSRVLHARHLTLKALGRRPGIPALMMAYSIGYAAKALPVPGGIEILDADRRAERFVMDDNCESPGSGDDASPARW